MSLRPVADVAAGVLLRDQYNGMAAKLHEAAPRLEHEAKLLKALNRPLTARLARERAFLAHRLERVAKRAALAELLDPQPVDCLVRRRIG